MITYIGYGLLVATVLALLSFRIGGVGIYIFTIATIVVIHNPFVNPLNFHGEFVNALLNIALAGIALFITEGAPKVGACSA